MSRKTAAALLFCAVLWPVAAFAQDDAGWGFVPGRKLLLFDDYRDIAQGGALSHWRVRGAAVGLVDGRLIVGGGSATRLTPNVATWPDAFTVEMNVLAKASEPDALRKLTWLFENGDAWVWQTTLTLYDSGSCDVFVEIADPGDNQHVACAWLRNEPNSYALWVQDGRLRIYLNGKRLVDMNQFDKKWFQTASLLVSPDAIPVSFGAFRIAQATPESGDATVIGGRDAAGGIRSSVGAAAAQPEPRPLQVPQLDAAALRDAITITAPKSGDIMATSSTYPISWQYQRESGPVRIELATASGGAPLYISPEVPLGVSGTGSFSWQIFENLSPADNYIVKITSLANPAVNATAGPFSIVRPAITLTAPAQGAVLTGERNVPIRWTYTGNNFGDQVRVTATLVGRPAPSLDAMNVPIGQNGVGEYGQWLPAATSDAQRFKIRVQSIQTPSIYGDVAVTVASTRGDDVPPIQNPMSPVLLRAIAVFDTQDENKDRGTSVTVQVKTRRDSTAVAGVVDAAGSSSDATEFRPNTSASLGLSVQPEIRLADCDTLALWVDMKDNGLDVLKFDRWRFKVRVELFFSDGTVVTKSSAGTEERGGFIMPPAQHIYGEVPGPTEVSAPPTPAAATLYAGLVSELRLRIQTGGDDLRGGSEVNAQVVSAGLPEISFFNINKKQRWSDNSTQTVILPFNQEVPLGSISGIRLTTNLAGDNWNLNAIEVSAVVNGAPVSLMQRSGNPLLFRFTGANGEYTITR